MRTENPTPHTTERERKGRPPSRGAPATHTASKESQPERRGTGLAAGARSQRGRSAARPTLPSEGAKRGPAGRLSRLRPHGGRTHRSSAVQAPHLHNSRGKSPGPGRQGRCVAARGHHQGVGGGLHLECSDSHTTYSLKFMKPLHRVNGVERRPHPRKGTVKVKPWGSLHTHPRPDCRRLTPRQARNVHAHHHSGEARRLLRSLNTGLPRPQQFHGHGSAGSERAHVYPHAAWPADTQGHGSQYHRSWESPLSEPGEPTGTRVRPRG